MLSDGYKDTDRMGNNKKEMCKCQMIFRKNRILKNILRFFFMLKMLGENDTLFKTFKAIWENIHFYMISDFSKPTPIFYVLSSISTQVFAFNSSIKIHLSMKIHIYISDIL